MTSQKILSRGAEAIIYKSSSKIIKDRIPKSYRLPQLDQKIRKARTRAEIKLLEKASKIIPVPKLTINEKNNFKIEMKYIDGKKLSEHLDKLSTSELNSACKQIGKNLSLLHNSGLIHGDLTTSNLILSSKDKKVYFIDFGLGFHSAKAEDKAVDLHLIKEALQARHSKIFQKALSLIMNEYKKHSSNSAQILNRLEKVEKRGRYKAQY